MSFSIESVTPQVGINGKVMVTGVDCVELTEAGKIQRVIGFY